MQEWKAFNRDPRGLQLTERFNLNNVMPAKWLTKGL